MATRSRTQLKGWFKTGARPTEAQFGDVFDSFYHKGDDAIPVSDVEGLPEQLNSKSPASELQALSERNDAAISQINAKIDQLSNTGSAAEISRIDATLKQVIGITDSGNNLLANVKAQSGYIDETGNIITA